MATSPTPQASSTTAVPRSAAFATAGLSSGTSTFGQSKYDEYHPSQFYRGAMQAAALGAQRNTGVPRLEALQANLARLEKVAEDRRAVLAAADVQARRLAAQERIALQRAASGRGVDKDFILELAKLRKGVYAEQRQEFGLRLDALDSASQQKLANSFGSTTALAGKPLGGAATAVAKAARAGQLSGLSQQEMSAVLSVEAAGTLEKARVRPEGQQAQAQHLSDAAAFAAALRDQRVPPQDAQQLTADLFNLNESESRVLTAEGTLAARERLSTGTVTELLPTTIAGENLAGLDTELQQLMMREYGIGPDGKFIGTTQQQQRASAKLREQDAQRLTPQEQEILDKYLMDLRDNGVVDDDQLRAAGQAIYRKAKDNRLYSERDAPLFDEQYLADIGATATARLETDLQQERVLGLAERTPEEIEREAARSFTAMVRDAEGLEREVAPGAASNYYESRVIGGAYDILEKEGNDVFDLKARPLDRKRRLGGAGPLASRPQKVALGIYNQYDGDPDSFDKAQREIRNTFRDADKRRLAETYLLAMYMQRERADSSGSADPGKLPTAKQERTRDEQVARSAPGFDGDFGEAAGGTDLGFQSGRTIIEDPGGAAPTGAAPSPPGVGPVGLNPNTTAGGFRFDRGDAPLSIIPGREAGGGQLRIEDVVAANASPDISDEAMRVQFGDLQGLPEPSANFVNRTGLPITMLGGSLPVSPSGMVGSNQQIGEVKTQEELVREAFLRGAQAGGQMNVLY